MRRSLWVLLGVLVGLVLVMIAPAAYARTPESRDNEEKYRPVIAAAEKANGLPVGLLHRVIFQESHFRSEIIDGREISSAGAVGIAQIIPRWHPTLNPRDPVASIKYAGKILADWRRKFGSWSAALAAYNWGPGNVSAFGLGNLPDETAMYVAEITRDTGVA